MPNTTQYPRGKDKELPVHHRHPSRQWFIHHHHLNIIISNSSHISFQHRISIASASHQHRISIVSAWNRIGIASSSYHISRAVSLV
jgi:hypothetical protein